MADTQSEIYAQAYGRNIMQLAQQKYAKLINYVFMRPNVTGKTFFQDRIGSWSMSVKGGRNVQTPNNDPSLSRRMGTLVDYHDARLLDRGDELRTISDPRSAYTIAAAGSLGRKIDDVILSAAVGTAYYGETGTSSVTHSNTVAVVTCGYPTLANVAAIKYAFDNADVEEEDRIMVITPLSLSNLLQVTAFTSADYAAVKALVRGEIDTFMGFKWITSTRVAQISGGNIDAGSYSCIAFQRFGVCLGMGAAPIVRTDERTDLSYSWQIYYELNIGGVRLEEARVVSGDTA
uniref:Putative capsid protein n=1 Tax=viral metagenome TaxID=1070528 RepID=A0A6M3XL24_9ZZZZ